VTRNFKLVIVSPSDAQTEVFAAGAAVLEFNDRYAGRFHISLRSYKRYMAPDLRRAQSAAFHDLGFYEADIIVGILWSRMGTPPGGTDPDTGQKYRSGTEEELAEAARLRSTNRLLRALVYECTRPPPTPSTSNAECQREEVKAYCEHLRTAKHFLIPTFGSTDEFNAMFFRDLENILLPLDTSPADGPSLGDKTWLCCDRSDQMIRFEQSFLAEPSPRDNPRLAFLICGLERDRPSSLAQRMSERIRLGRPQAHRTSAITLNVSEEQDLLRNLGRIWARAAFAGLDRSLAPIELSLDSLLSTPTFRGRTDGIVVIEHQLRLTRREEWSTAVRDALAWYLTTFCGTQPAQPLRVTVILLVTVICPDTMVDGFGVVGRGKRAKTLRDVRRDLEHVTERECEGCRRILLPPLKPIEKGHVLNWFNENQLYGTEAEWNEVIEQHFGNPIDFGERTMADVERALLKIHREFAAMRYPRAS
jgi:hypothetical protein